MSKISHWQILVSWAIAAVATIIPTPARSAEAIAVRYGLFELSMPVADLRRYAETGAVSSDLRDFLRFISPAQQQAVREMLQTKVPVDRVVLDRVLNGNAGIQFLSQIAAATDEGEYPGVQALRAAAILGIQSDSLTILDFLAAYPTRRLRISLPKALQLVDGISPKPPTDRLSTMPIWKTWVEYQTTFSQNRQYPVCLFGDSISSALSYRLGSQVYNFAIGGMSSESLVAQLKHLVAHQVRCQKVVIAIGTNDAWYTIPDEQFSQNLHQAIALTRQLGSPTIALLPAFYSTLAASKDPSLAGSLPRVDSINQLLNQVAAAEQIPVIAAPLQPLFAGNVLKQSLTTDGVHLNAAGLDIYQQALQEIFIGLSEKRGQP